MGNHQKMTRLILHVEGKSGCELNERLRDENKNDQEVLGQSTQEIGMNNHETQVITPLVFARLD